MALSWTVGMAKKECSAVVKELCRELKKRDAEGVAESSNAAEWIRFLQKQLATVKTFDKASPNYIDYVSRGFKPKRTTEEKTKPVKAAKPEEKTTEAKKRKEPTAKSDETAKAAKKVKADK